MPKNRFRLGCDIGGTCTDFVLIDEETGEIRILKGLTTATKQPLDAVVEGLEKLEKLVPGCIEQLDELIHGTTFVSNLLLERSGATTGLITTKGFRDVLELGRETRYALYDVFARFPEPLVDRRHRVEVDERIRSDGSILCPLDRDQAKSVVKELVDSGVESIAVCLINSFENPAHERLLEEVIREEAPQLPVSVSYDVLPQIQEYERTSTTVANAYIKPRTEEYLASLESALKERGFDGRILVMLSGGGIVSAETAAACPVRIIESGSAAAAAGAQHLSKLFDLPEMFCFEMGGTTATACLIQRGVASNTKTLEVGRKQRFMKGSGLPIQVPTLDITEIGGGGGSVAKVSRFGTLQVGPESSGATPGPVCFGRGGEQPTVTDADLLLGYLDADFFLGGELKLDREAAERAIEETLANPLDVSLMHAVWGIHDLTNEMMAAAAKMKISEKGGNPEDVTIVATGGAGPIHAYGLARKLGAPRVLIPPHTGVGSALSFFTAPRAFDLLRSHKVALHSADFAFIEEIFRELEAKGVQALQADSAAETSDVRFARSLDAHFIGHGADISIPLPEGDFMALDAAELRRRFDTIFKREYGREYPEAQLEIAHLRVRASLPTRLLHLPIFERPEDASIDDAIKGERQAFSSLTHGFVPHTVFDRRKLFPGASFPGPAIIEERESTIVVGEDAKVTVDERRFLWIDLPYRARNKEDGHGSV